MNRIKQSDLEYLVNRINEVTGSPMSYSIVDDNGKHHTQVGHYHLSGAYGGWMLARTMNEAGGIDTPLGAYHRPKRELYNEMKAFLTGLEQ